MVACGLSSCPAACGILVLRLGIEPTSPALEGRFLTIVPPGKYLFMELLFIYFLKFKKILFIYLFLAVLGLCCCTWAFSSCGERGLLFVTVCGLLIAVASLVAEHGL